MLFYYNGKWMKEDMEKKTFVSLLSPAPAFLSFGLRIVFATARSVRTFREIPDNGVTPSGYLQS
jgi:hypothetical protein